VAERRSGGEAERRRGGEAERRRGGEAERGRGGEVERNKEGVEEMRKEERMVTIESCHIGNSATSVFVQIGVVVVEKR
jgi:hypothetical protein